MFDRTRFVSSRTVATGPLTDDQLHAFAPSIFADAPHASRSSRYAHIPTATVLGKLRDNGFLPVKASQSKVRDNSTGRQDFTKHMIRFRHADYLQQAAVVGQVVPEVIMINSHDGTSSYQLSAGLFRFVCTNGMVVADSEIGAVRVQHTGNIVREVLQASFDVLDRSRKALTVAESWQQKQLSTGEQSALAEAAHHVRFADAAGVVDTPIRPEQLLRARRTADTSNDLWTTFNRVQENVIRGGVSAIGNGSDGRPRRTTTKEVKGIDGNVNLNKALWMLAERLAALR